MLYLIIIAAVLIAALPFGIRWWKSRQSFGTYKGKIPPYKTKTPMGVKVYSNYAVTDEHLRLIDSGISKVFDIAENVYGYTGFSRHERYNVALFPRSEKCINPGFLIETDGSNPYDQSEWDKDPKQGVTKICAAGMEILFEGNPGMIVVDDLSILETVVGYETEHLVLGEVDTERYERTKYHDAANPHPLLPDTRVVGFAHVTKPIICRGTQ